VQQPVQPPNTAWNSLPSARGRAATILRAFIRDELTIATVVLIIVTIAGAMILGSIVRNLVPANLAATGKQVVTAHVHPALQDMPSRVETNGKPLMVTIRATGTRVDPGYTAARFVFMVDPPNDAPITLCDGGAPTCSISLDGSRRQAGTWVITVQVYDNTGTSDEIRTRLRVV
jgi:hypothetical protein